MGYVHSGTVTFSGESPRSPRAALRLSDILACPFSGKFFAPWEARIRTEMRPNPPSAARTFFCPVCPSAALRIHALGAREAASCALCGWVASRASVHAATDLLARETDPWPAVSAVVSQRSAPAARPTHRAPPKKRSVAQCAADERASEAQLRGLHDSEDVSIGRKEWEDRDAERRRGSVRVAKILPLSVNVPARDVWLKESLPPRRRMREPKVILESPYAGRAVPGAVLAGGVANGDARRRNAARFMPAVVRARVTHDCFSEEDGTQKVKMTLVVRNVRAVPVHISITDAGAVEDANDVGAANARMAPSEQLVLEMETTPVHSPHGPAKTCSVVARLRVQVTFDAPDAGIDCDEEDAAEGAKPFWEHTWCCTAFVTHERSVLPEEGDVPKPF